MGGYNIYFKASVEKDLKSILRQDLNKILDRIRLLGSNQRPHGCEKLTGQDRCRIRQGRYRIVYSIQDKVLTVWIVAIGNRKDIYR